MSIKPILNGQIQLLTRQQLEQFIQGKKIDLNNVEIQFVPKKNSTNQYHNLSQEPQIPQQQQQQEQEKDQTLPLLSSTKLTQAQILPIINKEQEILNQQPQAQQTQQQQAQQQQTKQYQTQQLQTHQQKIQQQNQEISYNQSLPNDINEQRIDRQTTVPKTQFHFLPNSQTQHQSPANFQGFIQNTYIVQAPQSVLHSNLHQNNTIQNNGFQSQNFLNQNQQVQGQQISNSVDEQLKTSYMQYIYCLFVTYEVLILTCLILQYVGCQSIQAANLWISVQVFVIVSFVLLYFIYVMETLSYRLVVLGFRIFFFFLSEILEIAAFSLAAKYPSQLAGTFSECYIYTDQYDQQYGYKVEYFNVAQYILLIFFLIQFFFSIYFYYFYTKKDYETFQLFRKEMQKIQANILEQTQMVNQSQVQFIPQYPN